MTSTPTRVQHMMPVHVSSPRRAPSLQEARQAKILHEPNTGNIQPTATDFNAYSHREYLTYDHTIRTNLCHATQ